MNRLLSLTLLHLVLGGAISTIASDCHAEDVAKRDGTTRLHTETNTATRQQSKVASIAPSRATSFLVEAAIDPTEKANGDHQAIAGLAIGLSSPDSDAFPGKGRVCFELREGTTSGFWDIWVDGVNEGRREPSPKPPGWVDNRQYQKPWEFTPHAGLYRTPHYRSARRKRNESAVLLRALRSSRIRVHRLAEGYAWAYRVLCGHGRNGFAVKHRDFSGLDRSRSCRRGTTHPPVRAGHCS